MPSSNPPQPPPQSQNAVTPTTPQSTTESPRKATLLDALLTIKPADFTSFYEKPCARESLLTGIGAGFAIGGLRFATLIGRVPVVSTATSTSTSSTSASVSTPAPTTTNTTTTTNKISTPFPSSSLSSSSPPSILENGKPRKNGIPLAAAAQKSPPPSPRRAHPSTALSIAQRRQNSLLGRAWRSMTWAVLSFTLFSAGMHVFCQRRRSMERAAMRRAGEIMARKRAGNQKGVEGVV